MVTKSHRRKGRDQGMFLMCFKPQASAVTEESPVEVLDTQLLLSSSSSWKESDRKMKKGRRNLAGVFKAVFFQTPLAKKLGSESFSQNSSRSSSNLSTKNEKFMNSMKKTASYKELSDPDQQILRTNSNQSSLFCPASSTITSSSSSSSSSSSASISASERKRRHSSLDLKHPNTTKKSKKRGSVEYNYWKNNPTFGMCFVVACLVALVFWGKVVAILTCTTLWLFFVPRHDQHVNSPVKDIESEQYKKKVIMEGLLERNNRPRVL